MNGPEETQTLAQLLEKEREEMKEQVAGNIQQVLAAAVRLDPENEMYKDAINPDRLAKVIARRPTESRIFAQPVVFPYIKALWRESREALEGILEETERVLSALGLDRGQVEELLKNNLFTDMPPVEAIGALAQRMGSRLIVEKKALYFPDDAAALDYLKSVGRAPNYDVWETVRERIKKDFPFKFTSWDDAWLFYATKFALVVKEAQERSGTGGSFQPDDARRALHEIFNLYSLRGLRARRPEAFSSQQ